VNWAVEVSDKRGSFGPHTIDNWRDYISGGDRTKDPTTMRYYRLLKMAEEDGINPLTASNNILARRPVLTGPPKNDYPPY
jgi:hypothetical protein